jgi:hypothetical protein
MKKNKNKKKKGLKCLKVQFCHLNKNNPKIVEQNKATILLLYTILFFLILCTI